MFMEYNGMSAMIADYISNKAKEKLEKFDKNANKQLKASTDEPSQAQLELLLVEQRQKEEEFFKPINWLTDAARRAPQMKMVTHSLKFTHSSAKGSSLYCPGGNEQPEGIFPGGVVSTASLKNPKIDVVGNAAALDVAKLLQIECNGKTLIEYVEEDDISPFRPFTEDESQSRGWLESFKKVLMDGNLSSHGLAKQIYFPLENGRYHLLSVLHSSSLSHAFYERVQSVRYADGTKEAREAKRKEKYNAMQVINYPNIAVQNYGGTKPQNISLLNSQRGGKGFLFSCAPPSWEEAQVRLPLRTKTIFHKNYFGFRAKRKIQALQQYLLRQKKKSKSVRYRRECYIDELIDHLIQYAAEIQNISDKRGWSVLSECKLSREEQLWLDPYRSQQDDAFAEEREKNDWQAVIADKFAGWLNSSLENKELKIFGDVEHREWRDSLEPKLRQLRDDLEVFL